MKMRKGYGKGLGMGYKNLMPMDSHIHSLSAKGVKTIVVDFSSAKSIKDAGKKRMRLIYNQGMKEVKTEQIGLDKFKMTFNAKGLPLITYKGKQYYFDYRLSELREKDTIKSIKLNNSELELLDYALSSRDPKLIRVNMDELSWKLNAKGKQTLTIEPTYVPRGSGNNPYGGKRDLAYKIKEWGFIFSDKESAEKYAKEHIEINGEIIEKKEDN